jgi:hypothetical protein
MPPQCRSPQRPSNDQLSAQHRCGWDNFGRYFALCSHCFALAGILVSLGSALVYLIRDKGTTNRTVNADDPGRHFGRTVSVHSVQLLDGLDRTAFVWKLTANAGDAWSAAL